MDFDNSEHYPSASTTTYNCYVSVVGVNNNLGNTGEKSQFLCSSDGRRVRVFVSEDAAIKYSVKNRKVYVTQKFYDYVPEDLTVSIDDLQNSVDDLQKVIDELLKKISDKTSEKEIMELLKLILEELRNQQGTGGGGSGSGDVTVNVDMTQTNSWLSKIYAKVSAIFDKLSSSAGKTLDDVVRSIDDLSGMLKRYLVEITGDLDDIKNQLKEMSEEEFNERSDSFLQDSVDSFSEISEVAKTRFPFSIISDMRMFLSKFSTSPPGLEAEPAADVSLYSTGQIALYADGDHGGGGGSRPGEETPPGGGGASRPDRHLVSVEQGGSGSEHPVLSPTGAPIFYLPFVIASAGIDYMVVIDMSGFEAVSQVCRTLFTFMFMLCLVNLTFKVIGLWGDLVQ